MRYLTDTEVQQYVAAQRAENPEYWPEISPAFARELAQQDYASWQQRKAQRQAKADEVERLRRENADLARRVDRLERFTAVKGPLISALRKTLGARIKTCEEVIDKLIEPNCGLDAMLERIEALEQRAPAPITLPTPDAVAAVGRGPAVHDAGTWNAERNYQAGDLTTCRDAMWVATISSRGLKPGDGQGWRLLHKTEMAYVRKLIREELRKGPTCR